MHVIFAFFCAALLAWACIAAGEADGAFNKDKRFITVTIFVVYTALVIAISTPR